jgi:phosphatidylglycerophosphatase A
MRNLVIFIATGAGSGYSPIASGTAGSVVGVALFAALTWGLGLSTLPLLAVTVAVTLVGVWAAERAEGIFGGKDDGHITIDEVAGQLIALLALPVRWEVMLVGFFLFRFFDIVKPPPARQLESVRGGVGVMGDDVFAGIYANVVGQVLWRTLAAVGWP